MAADSYTGWTHFWTPPQAVNNPRDNWQQHLGSMRGYTSKNIHYDATNDVWIAFWFNGSTTTDWIVYTDYSDSGNILSISDPSTGWTTTTGNYTHNNTSDFMRDVYVSKDTTNDKYVVIAQIRDNSLGEDELSIIHMTFSGTDSTFSSRTQINGDATLSQASVLALPADPTATTYLAEDTAALIGWAGATATTNLYFGSYFWDHSTASTWTANGSDLANDIMGNHQWVPKHGSDPYSWHDTADAYNATFAEMVVTGVRNGDLYSLKLYYDTASDSWKDNGATETKIMDGGLDFTTGTQVQGQCLWYDPTAAKWYVLAFSDDSTDLETLFFSSSDGETWSSETNVPDNEFNDNYTGTLASVYPYSGQCGALNGGGDTSYITWKDSVNDSIYLNHAGHFMSYNSTTDTWTYNFSLDPPAAGSNSDQVMSTQLLWNGSAIYAAVCLFDKVDDVEYWYVQPFNQSPSVTFTEPEDGAAIESRNAVTLKWTYSDPDSDPQAHYRIRRVVDATTTTYWDGSTSSWVSTETAGTKIASTAAQFQLNSNWGDASSETSHAYSVAVWDDQGNSSGYADTVTIYPSSSVSTIKGYSLPRPIKRQADINTTLRSNQDYSVSWINSYVPSYGDLNDDLYLKGGLRPSSTSRLRNVFPPVVGSFSLGNSSNYFQDIAATNVYRTNELALSSARAKQFRELRDKQLLKMVLEVPVEEFTYKDERLNGDTTYRYGLVAEDIILWMRRNQLDQNDYSFISYQEDANNELLPYLHADQLVPVLWKAVQELYAILEDTIPPGKRVALRRIDDSERRRDRE